ncbi:hypothetical protein [Lysobacter gummosus]
MAAQGAQEFADYDHFGGRAWLRPCAAGWCGCLVRSACCRCG